ncbi:MAG: hypothetical protein JWQ90_4553 [Hydrocarboniphaga sp.]|uniref:hypothetical protein n=1 Tax=Hydrocarboniphaga sp. TaxID=2033016 RepID=UPI002637488A|nr:hypothetical protein [Hydrocarboniphaga sp.]MDB5972103.1 hypothetical protein [Hydrocarboniphaga sp.]
MHLQTAISCLATRRAEFSSHAVSGTLIRKRIVCALLDTFDLLGRELGGAVLTHQNRLCSGPHAGSVLLPLSVPRDDL